LRILIDDDPISKGLDIKEFDIVATTYQAGRALIFYTISNNDEIYFDHDLNSLDPKWTGFDLLKIAFQLKKFPLKIVLVTNNPIGRKNMQALLEEHNYIQKEYNEFHKN